MKNILYYFAVVSLIVSIALIIVLSLSLIFGADNPVTLIIFILGECLALPEFIYLIRMRTKQKKSEGEEDSPSAC